MRLLILFTFLIFGISYSQAQFRTLKDFQWENRLLIIYTGEEKSGPLDSQLSEITQNQKGYKDRDLKVILLKDKQVEIWKSETPNQLEYNEIIVELNIEESESYQNLLIGKDGGVKMRNDSPISTKKLFNTIDAMPMRQQEMRDGN